MMNRRRVIFLASIIVFVGAILSIYFVLQSQHADIKNWVDALESNKFKLPHTITVQAVYPGANATIVADTVAAPIEEQIDGLEHMVSMSSLSANDGSYILNVTFDDETDINLAQVLIQDRVGLAAVILPELVRPSIRILKRSPQPVILVCLTAIDNKLSSTFLGNFAVKSLADEIARIPDIGEVVIFGLPRDPGLVAGVVSDSNQGNSATADGKPAIVLGVYPQPNAVPGNLSRALGDKLAEVRSKLPEGLASIAFFDFARHLEDPDSGKTPEHLFIDAQLPDSASVERVAEALARAGNIVRQTSGVQEVLALTEHPFAVVRNRPCLIAILSPGDQPLIEREKIAANLRRRLESEIPEAMFRLSLPSGRGKFPLYGYPIDFIIQDRSNLGRDSRQKIAEEIRREMNQSKKFLDICSDSGLRDVPTTSVEIDRSKCKALGIEVAEVVNTLQLYLGPKTNLNRFDPTGRVIVRVDDGISGCLPDILSLQVKNKQNQLIRLKSVAEERHFLNPRGIERYNKYPIERITANLSEGVAFPEAKLFCDELAERQLDSKQYKLIWQPR